MKNYLLMILLGIVFIQPVDAKSQDTKPKHVKAKNAKPQNTKPKYDQDLTHQESILLSCLQINYAGIDVDLKDHSANRYTYGTQIKMHEFVEKEAGSFYQEHYPIYMENTPPPYTRIFMKCVHFSKSNKVKRFLRTLDLTICKPKSEHFGCPEINF